MYRFEFMPTFYEYGLGIILLYSNNLLVFPFNQDLSFQAAQLNLKNSPATITLISRRCTRRLGMMSFGCFVLLLWLFLSLSLDSCMAFDQHFCSLFLCLPLFFLQ